MAIELIHRHTGRPLRRSRSPADHEVHDSHAADAHDQHYPNALAGFGSTHAPNGDPNEALGTLWNHDHRVELTSQNVDKGLAGFYCLFDNLAAIVASLTRRAPAR